MTRAAHHEFEVGRTVVRARWQGCEMGGECQHRVVVEIIRVRRYLLGAAQPFAEQDLLVYRGERMIRLPTSSIVNRNRPRKLIPRRCCSPIFSSSIKTIATSRT